MDPLCFRRLVALTRFHRKRVVLLEIWKAFEEKYGTTEEVIKVQGMMPITSKRRVVDKETGQTVEGTLITSAQADHVLSSVSDWDIVFADDERESNPTSFKFLQMAHAWKASQAKAGSGSTAALSGFLAAANAPPASVEPRSVERDAQTKKDEDGGSDVASSNGDED